MNARSVFVYGRPGPHPFHRALAETIAPDFVPVDFMIRWYDVPASQIRRYLSWIVCALLFPNRRKYDVFLSDGIQFLPPLMRRLGLLRREQKVAALVDNETLFFLRAGRYPKATARALIWAMNQYDVLICIGRMQSELAAGFARPLRPVILTAKSGVARDRLPALLQNQPALSANTVLFIGNGPSDWRGWYKGLDVLLRAIELVGGDIAELRLCIVGEWDREYLGLLGAQFPGARSMTDFVGRAADLSPHLASASLYVHLGRGEAFGISVLEAMCGGLPALVSEWTGAREAVEQVDPRLVVPCAAESAAERILWYFSLPLARKRELSARSRDVAGQYTEERALRSFVEVYREMLRRFDLPDLPGAAVKEGSASA